MVDVHVVGGGPAGCFAGIAACQRGASVLLSEEHKSIGQPEACSGLISRSGLNSLSKYIDCRKITLNTITSAKIHSGGLEFVISPKQEVAVLVSRCHLDLLCAEKFEQEGGKLELGKKVTGDFAASSIIGADGPASFVASKFGFPKISSYVACMQGNFRYHSENPHQTQVFLSSQDFPGFFGWAIPINEEEAKIGLGVSFPNHPLKHYRRFLARLGVNSSPVHEFSAVIPTSVRPQTAMEKGGKKILLAGDSAGQVKATTGGGIFFGASCGALAGQFFDDPPSYERGWKGQFYLDLALHGFFRSILNLGGGQPNHLLLSASKSLFFEDLISEKGRMDRLGQMLQPTLPLSYAEIIARRLSGAAP